MNRESTPEQQVRLGRTELSSHCEPSGEIVKCPTRVSAIRLTMQPGGGMALGALTQIEAGTSLEICGEGYNERTIKVRVAKEFFCVFRQDVC